MSIQSRRILGDSLPSGSSGDGASQDGPTDPNTGQSIGSYTAPAPSPRQSTAGALGAEDAHGDVASYHRASAAASGIQNTAGAGGLELEYVSDRAEETE